MSAPGSVPSDPGPHFIEDEILFGGHGRRCTCGWFSGYFCGAEGGARVDKWAIAHLQENRTVYGPLRLLERSEP